MVIGEINADLVLTGDIIPTFGQAEKLIDDATLTIGSSGAIFACGATRLGLQVSYSGVADDDMFGRFMLDRLQERGVDTFGIRVEPALKTGLSVILSPSQDRAILTHLGSIDAQTAEYVPRALLRRTQHIYLTSHFLQTQLQAGLPDLLTEARALGCTISMDTNWDHAEQWASGLDKVLPLIDIFLPNEQEALAITGQATIAEALSALAQIIPTVVIKLGADGAICQHAGEQTQHPGFPATGVDTTGTGDSFDAGFLYGILQSWSLVDSLALACACGTLSIRKAGGTGDSGGGSRDDKPIRGTWNVGCKRHKNVPCSTFHAFDSLKSLKAT